MSRHSGEDCTVRQAFLLETTIRMSQSASPISSCRPAAKRLRPHQETSRHSLDLREQINFKRIDDTKKELQRLQKENAQLKQDQELSR